MVLHSLLLFSIHTVNGDLPSSSRASYNYNFKNNPPCLLPNRSQDILEDTPQCTCGHCQLQHGVAWTWYHSFIAKKNELIINNSLFNLTRLQCQPCILQLNKMLYSAPHTCIYIYVYAIYSRQSHAVILLLPASIV